MLLSAMMLLVSAGVARAETSARDEGSHLCTKHCQSCGPVQGLAAVRAAALALVCSAKAGGSSGGCWGFRSPCVYAPTSDLMNDGALGGAYPASGRVPEHGEVSSQVGGVSGVEEPAQLCSAAVLELRIWTLAWISSALAMFASLQTAKACS